MNKSELVAAIAERTGKTKKDTNQFVDALLAVIKEELTAERKVNLSGFGKFETVQRKERRARNPKTGVSVTVPARRTVVFRPGTELKAF
ncbi:HU family DNA-binding protein [Leptolyngbya sp. AN03gr2]|uniref:HU family DNA-binding protein n=1 Tax=Leptolyngbya sp. AN03gr2 TaxID=3423364 RepID=UPI003D317596